MSNDRNLGCETGRSARSVSASASAIRARFCDLFRCLWSVSVSVPVSVVCIPSAAPTECSHRNRNRTRLQKPVRITETGTGTDLSYRHRNRHGSRITETETETGTETEKNFPAPTKTKKAQHQVPGLSGYDYASVHSAGCGATDLALPPADFTPALSEILWCCLHPLGRGSAATSRPPPTPCSVASGALRVAGRRWFRRVVSGSFALHCSWP